MYDLAIHGVQLAEREGRWTIGIQDGKIASVISEDTTAAAREKIDAEGKAAMPGVIDAHVHTRDPGYPHKEDAHSAAMAAAAGGVTTIMAMPNCNPPMTTGAAVRYAAGHMARQDIVDILAVGGICAAMPGWGTSAVQAGAAALDVYDDIYSWGTQTWIQVFQTAKGAAVPLCFYLMDPAMEQLRRTQRAEAGSSDEEQIAGATDGETEAISIARIFPMADYFQVPVVLRMVTTARALEVVRMMRRLYPDAKVYVEVCVPYLFLTRAALMEQGGRAHIHPPLRREEDVEALWAGISDGTVDYLATDHAPHAAFEKNRGQLSDCASGLVGLETMMPLLLDAASKGRLSLADIQRLCCEAPASIYGLAQKGAIRVGADADLILIDPGQCWQVCGRESYTRGAPGPFEGFQLQGRPCMTIHRGKIVMETMNGFPMVKE
jgi:dihydroorotase (multifunctional complex type)